MDVTAQTVSMRMDAVFVAAARMVVVVIVVDAHSHGLSRPPRSAKPPQRTRTVGDTDIPGPSSTSGLSLKTILTGTRCTTFT